MILQYFLNKQALMMQTSLLLCSASLSVLFDMRAKRTIMKHFLKYYILKGVLKHFIARIAARTLAIIVFIALLTFSALFCAMAEVNADVLLTTISLASLWLGLVAINSLGYEGKKYNWIMITVMLVAIIHTLDYSGISKEIMDHISVRIVDLHITFYVVCKAILALFVLHWISSIVLSVGRKLIIGRSEGAASHSRQLYVKLFNYAVYLIFAVVVLTIVGVQSAHIALFGSAIGIGIGFGLQKMASNFISGIVLLAEKNIKIGDVLQLDSNHLGIVKNLGFRAAVIDTMDGGEVIVPNEHLITKSITNYTLENCAIKIIASVLIYSPEKTIEALTIMRNTCARQKNISKIREFYCTIAEVNLNGILLKATVWIDDVLSCNLGILKSKLLEEIVEGFNEKGIELFFYPIAYDELPQKRDAVPPVEFGE